MILEANLKKSTVALSALTLALAAGLSACSGGTSTYTIDGTVVGLEYPGLILSNNGEDITVNPNGYDEPPAGSTGARTPRNVTYSFSRQLDYGEPYNVVLKQNPQHQKCDYAQNTIAADTAGRLSANQVVFVCGLATHQIGGTVSGLTAGGLELLNGSNGGKVAVPANATEFVFPIEVTYNQSFGVTVLTQPTGLTCTVSNGAGIMGDEPVKTVAVACRPNA